MTNGTAYLMDSRRCLTLDDIIWHKQQNPGEKEAKKIKEIKLLKHPYQL